MGISFWKIKMRANAKYCVWPHLWPSTDSDYSLNNLVSAIEQGIISNTTGKRLRELEEQQANLEKQILIERNKIAIKMSESDIREF